MPNPFKIFSDLAFFYYQMLSLMCYCGRVFDVSVSLHSYNFIKHQMLRKNATSTDKKVFNAS